jgi:hypothetical protein
MKKKTLELGKMYKTPWKTRAYPVSSVQRPGASEGRLSIDAGSPLFLDDGDYVVVLEVHPYERIVYRPSETGTQSMAPVTEYDLKLLTGEGRVVVANVTAAGLDYWKKVSL